jgi:hypothetical protein
MVLPAPQVTGVAPLQILLPMDASEPFTFVTARQSMVAPAQIETDAQGSGGKLLPHSVGLKTWQGEKEGVAEREADVEAVTDGETDGEASTDGETDGEASTDGETDADCEVDAITDGETEVDGETVEEDDGQTPDSAAGSETTVGLPVFTPLASTVVATVLPSEQANGPMLCRPE